VSEDRRFIGFRRKPLPFKRLHEMTLADFDPPTEVVEAVYEGDPGWEELERERRPHQSG
jgi:hypothetical protein